MVIRTQIVDWCNICANQIKSNLGHCDALTWALETDDMRVRLYVLHACMCSTAARTNYTRRASNFDTAKQLRG